MSKEPKRPADKQLSDEMLRERAYYIWEEEGRPEGRDLDHWLVAQTGEFPTSGRKASKSTPKKSPRKKATVASKAAEDKAGTKKKAAKSKKKAPKKS